MNIFKKNILFTYLFNFFFIFRKDCLGFINSGLLADYNSIFLLLNIYLAKTLKK